MKPKIITIAALGVLLYSCASKTPPIVTQVKSEPAPKGVMTKELAEGQNIYENNCAKCHKLFNPNDFSSKDWKPILVEMQKKAHLDNAQIASISDYINSQL